MHEMTQGSAEIDSMVDPLTLRMTKTEAPPRQSWTASEWLKIRAANDVTQFVPESPPVEEPEIIRLRKPEKPLGK